MAHSSLFSNHGNVLLVLAEDPESRLRDVAASVGITERAVQKIVRDLQDEGLLSVHKHGRRNRYRINTRKALRHPLSTHRTVGHLLNLMREDSPVASGSKTKAPSLPRDQDIEPPAAGVEPSPSPALAAKGDAEAEPGDETPESAQDQPQEEPSPTPSPRRKKKKAKRPDPDEQQGSLF